MQVMGCQEGAKSSCSEQLKDVSVAIVFTLWRQDGRAELPDCMPSAGV